METPTYIRGHWQGEVLDEINWLFAFPSDHQIKKLVNRLLDIRLHRLNMLRDEERLDHRPLVHVFGGVHVDEGGLVFGGRFGAGAEFWKAWSCAFLYLHCVGHLGFFFSPQDLDSEQFTLDNRASVATAQTSLYFVTSHATEPSKSLTCEMGSVARRRAYSAGGSRPEARLKGKEGNSAMAILRIGMGSLRLGVAMDDLSRCDVTITGKTGSSLAVLPSQPFLARLNKHFIVCEYFLASTPLKSNSGGPEVQASVGVRYYIS